MKIARKDIILHTIQNHNILPITSACNTKCLFCSHQFNPSDLEVYQLPKLNLSDIKDMIDFLNPNKKIIIGESATRIVEGEPFIRKDILEILESVRNSFSEEIIEITTNGTKLNEYIVKKLKQLDPIELNVSLNSSSDYGRKYLQGDKDPERVLQGIKLLNKHNIEFHGSIVAMPMTVGYEDIKDTITYLDNNNCKTIRILTPGFAKSSDIKFDINKLREDLHRFIISIQKDIQAPILLDPPIIKELSPVVEGVIKNSLADKAGIKPKDIIYDIDGYKPKTRVDCFNYIYKSKNPTLKIKRKVENQYKNLEIQLKKKSKTSPGFVMLYDISILVKENINETIRKNKSKMPVVLVSELGQDIMKILLKEELDSQELRIEVVRNDFFGGSIKSAGLLLVEDIIKSIDKVKKDYEPDLIIIPSNSFDYKERDLMGISVYDIEEKTNIKYKGRYEYFYVFSLSDKQLIY